MFPDNSSCCIICRFIDNGTGGGRTDKRVQATSVQQG